LCLGGTSPPKPPHGDESATAAVITASSESRPVLFNLFAILIPLIYFRVCYGTPVNKNLKTRITCKKSNMSLLNTQQVNSYYRSSKERNLMTRLFLHFWNVGATFRIWSSGKKNPYFKYVSFHFLTLTNELHLVRFGGGASFTFELHGSLPSTPWLLLLFASHKKICYYASSGLTK